MSRVLVVNESTTLRFLLARDLEMNDYEVVQAASFADAFECLKSSKEQDIPLEAVVFSWPTMPDPDHIVFSELLISSKFLHLSVIVLAQVTSDKVLLWTRQRPKTAFTLLTQCKDIPATLDQLCKAGEESSDMYNKADDDPVRILFVDDSRSIRKYYEHLLSQNHYSVTTAGSVREAWRILGTNAFDIVITDYFMPKENGYILCNKIRKEPRLSHLMTAVLTGTYMDKAIKDSLNAGAMECMFKEEANELFLARVLSMARTVRNQKAINAEGQRLAGILASVGEGVYGVDVNGVISFANPATLKILGYPKDTDLIGKNAHECIHPIDQHGEAIEAADSLLQNAYAEAEGLLSWEMMFTHQSGRTIPVDCTVFPLMIDSRHEGSVVAFRDVSERKLMEQKLRWQATHDPLTELFNRRYFEEQLKTEFRRVGRSDHTSALLFLDLDRFKQVNDTAGHDAGDKLLIMISKQLSSRVRDSDTLARLGGDEFAVILRDLDSSTAQKTADSFRNVLSSIKFSHGDHQFNVHGSIGVAIINNQSESVSQIMTQADTACHQAKLKGRNQSHIFDPKTDIMQKDTAEVGWRKRLQEALDNDLFVLHFQPMLKMSDIELSNLPAENGKLWETHRLHREKNTYVEVLIRLIDKNNELIMPNAFLNTAERFGLMTKLDVWIVKRAIKTLDDINSREQNYTLGVNLSAQTIGNEEALQEIFMLVDNMKTPRSGLAFEVSESVAISNLHDVKNFLDQIKQRGCRFLLDRFGTGFSSFPQLRHLPIDFVKIDSQYVKNMARDAIDRAVVTAINDVAHSIGRHTIAEHVESPETLRLLKICGVDYLQGNYISTPMTHDELLEIEEDEPTIIASSLT